MSNVKLSMSVERSPDADGVPLERRGLLMARICVTSGERGNDITLLADRDDTFTHSQVSAMLRLFAGIIDRKYSETQEAA